MQSFFKGLGVSLLAAFVVGGIGGAMLGASGGNPVGGIVFMGILGVVFALFFLPVPLVAQSLCRHLLPRFALLGELVAAILLFGCTAMFVVGRMQNNAPGTEFYAVFWAAMILVPGVCAIAANRPKLFS